MFGLRNVLPLAVISVIAAGCAGGAIGTVGNAQPGLYEAAYSRGGGSLAINIPPTGNIIAFLVDESGGNFTGKLTQTTVQGVTTYTGTLDNTQAPTTTVDLMATLSGGQAPTISGSLTGAFSVSFTADKVSAGTSETPFAFAGNYTGTVSMTQNGQPLDSGTVNASSSSTGVFNATFTSTAHPTETGSVSATITVGAGVIGLLTPPGGSELVLIGTITKPDSTHVTITFTLPGSSPSETITGTMNLTKV